MSSVALDARASRRPRSTAVLLEARRRLPERPRRRKAWVIGGGSQWLGFAKPHMIPYRMTFKMGPAERAGHHQIAICPAVQPMPGLAPRPGIGIADALPNPRWAADRSG